MDVIVAVYIYIYNKDDAWKGGGSLRNCLQDLPWQHGTAASTARRTQKVSRNTVKMQVAASLSRRNYQ